MHCFVYPAFPIFTKRLVPAQTAQTATLRSPGKRSPERIMIEGEVVREVTEAPAEMLGGLP